MERTFRTVSVKDRMPDFRERILFTKENYEGGFVSEYQPMQEIEIKKGKFILMKDFPGAIDLLRHSFSYWLEEIESNDKKLLDLMNWVKSDISQEENPKLGKNSTKYRRDKLKFLYKIEQMLR